MIHWANSAASECLNELPDGIPKRCKAKDVCPFLARKGKCNKQWKDLEPIYHPIRDKYCTFSELDGVTRMMKVRKFCEKSCKVCGMINIIKIKSSNIIKYKILLELQIMNLS